MQRSMPLAGSDILYIVAPSSNINQSTVLAEFDLNPIELTSVTRLRQFAPLWDKFKWKSLWLAYKPSCGANAQGILGVAADPDKLDNYTTLAGLPLDQKVASSLHNFSGPVNRPWSMRITDSKFFGMSRFMEPAANSDPRMYTAGKLVITNEGLLTAGNYGRFYLYWKIDFEEPNTDEVVDQAIGFAAGLTGTYISATYPWGDYSAIQAAGFTANTVFKNTNFVTFKSDATLGSVIEFLRQGNYLVTITRTGVAMGTGSFTGATYSNCSVAWDSDEYGTGLNQAISNGGSTASQWVVAIKVTALPAYMADTADAGVTHTTGITTVSFVDDIPTSDDFTEAKVLKALKKLTVADLMKIMQSKISCTSPDEPWVKFPPRTLRSVPPEPLATGNLVETVSGTINQGDGPSQTITLNTTGTLDMGTITDPVFVEIDALRKKVQRAKEKKIMMRKRLEELELESSDSDS